MRKIRVAEATSELNLRSRKNRNRLRKAGFSDREIEELFVHLEELVIVPIAWRCEAATKLPGNYPITTGYFFPTPGSVQAAEAGMEVRA